MARQRMYDGGRVPSVRTMTGVATIQTTVLLPATMWEIGKFMAARERCTLRTLILRGLDRELSELQTKWGARPNVEFTEAK